MKRTIAGLFLLAVIVTLWSSLYTVSETDQVILTQFGKPIGNVVSDPGLHVKLPVVQTVHRFDKRWLEFNGEANEIPTKDKKYIWVDTYARWRIANPLRFYQAVQDERGGQGRLDDIIDGKTRDAVAHYDLIEVVRSTNREFQSTEKREGGDAAETRAEVKVGRETIAQEILKNSAEITPQFGVELVDVRFKRINYVASVQRTVFDRMITERKRIAERSRSEGQGRAAEIRGRKERDVRAATSVGYRKAQEIKGKADAEATAIYARAYNRDVDFYQFLKSMETLDASLDDKAWLILSTDSELLRYLKRSEGR
jgi:membrane protease subunit HflC